MLNPIAEVEREFTDMALQSERIIMDRERLLVQGPGFRILVLEHV